MFLRDAAHPSERFMPLAGSRKRVIRVDRRLDWVHSGVRTEWHLVKA
jgi:hypothetical protein